MPNWCYTQYKFVGDANEIAELHNILKELDTMSEPLVANEFGNMWLGCVVHRFGGDWNMINCRGEIEYMELCGENMLQLSTLTAWGDMPEVWNFVLKQYPNIEYFYLAEEPGCQYYINSDSSGEYFPEKYYLYDCGGGADYLNDQQTLFEQVATRIQYQGAIKSFRELNLLINKYNESNPDRAIYYNEFTCPNQ